ncbi:MAG: hypothetical protein OEM29_08525 [Thermoplasmata archaeon]|nr:hypothetical protein [Thermoplasmata archaeon]
MDEEGFRRFLTDGRKVPKGLSRESVDSNIEAVRGFERDLEDRGAVRLAKDATQEDVEAHIEALISRKQNDEGRLVALLRYARFAGNRDVELAVLRLLDGASVLGQLSETIREYVGDSKHEAVFKGVKLPELGSSPKGWHTVTQKFMDQLEEHVDSRTCKDILLTGPHSGPPEWYEEERRAYLGSKDLDDFLRLRHEKAVDTLRKHMEEHTLFFNQEIDQSVLDFVTSNQEIMGGVRRGTIIYETKIPYLAREYLREHDSTMKRYHYCHCPWVREAIRTGTRVSPTFCYCSAGYHKKPWELIFGKPVEVEIISSVLNGGHACRFAIHIPVLTNAKHHP